MSDNLVDVALLQLPVQTHRAAEAHQEALQREFDLIRAAHPEGRDVPHRLFELIEELEARYGGVGAEAEAELAAAVERGAEEIDLYYHVPVHAADAARRLSDLLDEADTFCRRGDHLLTLATPPDALAYRRWFLGEFVGQILHAAPPLPWPRYRAPAPPGPVPTMPSRQQASTELPAGWALDLGESGARLQVVGEVDLVTAPLLRDILQRVRDSGPPQVTIDASAVDFVDSVGISVLVTAHKRFHEESLPYALEVSSKVRRSLAISGLDDVLHIGGAPR